VIRVRTSLTTLVLLLASAWFTMPVHATVAHGPLHLLGPLPATGVLQTHGHSPRGRHAQSRALPHSGQVSNRATSCLIYGDVSSSPLFPKPQSQYRISNLDVLPSGQPFSHGLNTATASASGGGLFANTGSMAPKAVNPQVTRNVAGFLYKATTLACTPASFTMILRSNPPGSTNTVLATSGNYQISATYSYNFVDMGLYYCSYSYSGYFPCEVWRADTTFYFQTPSFQAASTYHLQFPAITVNTR